MTKMKEKLGKLAGLIVVILITAATIVVPLSYGRVKPYYDGDAINYRGRLFICSTNMNRLQLLEANDGHITLLAELTPDKSGHLPGDDFYNCVFHEEGNELFLYAVNGRYLYKYNVNNPQKPELVSRVKDNSWDWFRSVAVFDGRITTAGTKGVKIWNNDLQVIDNLTVKLDNPFNYTLSRDFLVAVDGAELKMYSLRSREWVNSVSLTVKENGNRQIYNDSLSSSIYVVDDWAVKQFDFNGNLLNTFKFTGTNGYDIVPSTDGQKLYFSDGIGVVRLNKANLQPEIWSYVRDMGVSDGWSMGLKLVNWQGRDHLVVFNNGAITVLNDQLKKVASYNSTEERPIEQAVYSEPLSLSLDKNRAPIGSEVSLRGTGFLPNESLEIKFLSNPQATSTVVTNNLGRFQKTLTVPQIASGVNPSINPWPTDIRVTGKTSLKTYSINFQIEY